jgi:hypothetical protein
MNPRRYYAALLARACERTTLPTRDEALRDWRESHSARLRGAR